MRTLRTAEIELIIAIIYDKEFEFRIGSKAQRKDILEGLRLIKWKALRDKFLLEVNFIDIDLHHLPNGINGIEASIPPTVFVEVIPAF